MNINEISEDKLNLFIDEELDTDEMNEIHEALLDHKSLRERVCQLRAVRELVEYAYSEVPPSRYKHPDRRRSSSLMNRAIAASVTLVVGVIVGWSTYDYNPVTVNAISAENTFQFVANHVTVDHKERKIILHIDSSDVRVVNAALDEADNLLASYRKANKPIKLDIITNKSGIDVLRPGMSPYLARVQKLVDDSDVSVFACQRSINKAIKKEGVEVVLLKGVTTNKTARELIPERLKKGWVYIKA